MLPKWDKTFSVHNAKIDEQHKKLFEIAGKVEYLIDKPVYKDEIKNLLAELFKTYLGRNPNCFSGWAECQRA
ncbi:Hemerythrin-like iron-binding protein [Campylobacter jejuni subsp. doylei]|uniref:Hemerythrin-like iron-binding protein n=1 Tax=Campylobacter jejuni subsp. doylei TaxID=32021 RepID=A0A3S4U785_CAMJU|nr:Hemerythrin-like iron-binding protein [Campylobacter jejuni subsp. doylei]